MFNSPASRPFSVLRFVSSIPVGNFYTLYRRPEDSLLRTTPSKNNRLPAKTGALTQAEVVKGGLFPRAGGLPTGQRHIFVVRKH